MLDDPIMHPLASAEYIDISRGLGRASCYNDFRANGVRGLLPRLYVLRVTLHPLDPRQPLPLRVLSSNNGGKGVPGVDHRFVHVVGFKICKSCRPAALLCVQT